MSFVTHRFKLEPAIVENLYSRTPSWGFGGFSEFIFFRTYSRQCCHKCRSSNLLYDTGSDYCGDCGYDGKLGQETWHDCVRRVIEGIMSIRKDWYIKNNISWDESFWQHYAMHMGITLFNMEWMPPGRGLWACGTNFVYERGSFALNNCAFLNLTDNLAAGIAWIQDALMCGTGVGFNPLKNDSLVAMNPTNGTFEYVIPDSREGWVESTRLVIDSYLQYGSPKVKCVYDEIRDADLPIRGFGGFTSGAGPLKLFHEQIRQFFDMYMTHNWYGSVMLKADLANCAGTCTVSGNVRRSAELCAGEIDDISDLKEYDTYPHREAHGWMSNNSCLLRENSDFERLGEIADRVIHNGEPGIINLRNVPYGRIGKSMEGLRLDKASGFNPCGEIGLESDLLGLGGELCCLAGTNPTKSNNWMKTLEYATVYASTVSLLPTHSKPTNAIIARNRRIGVGIVDVCKWQKDIGTTRLIKNLREGYEKVRTTNNWTNDEAGVPRAIRVTSVQPGGTTPKMCGVRSGWQNPTFGLTLRRVRIGANSPVCQLLKDANTPNEPDLFSANTQIFEWPIDQSDGGTIKPVTEVGIWQQATMLALLQREWADNSVSCTIYFKPKWPLVMDLALGESFYEGDVPKHVFNTVSRLLPISWDEFLKVQELEADMEYVTIPRGLYRFKLRYDKYASGWRFKVYKFDPNHEEDAIEPVLASTAPLIKSMSLLPHTAMGVYPQMPEEGISKEEYDKRLAAIKPIDWSKLSGSDGQDEKYCQGASCEVS